jgi:ubiquinone/menaquinone biosynthesis C-methylase UbiE
MSNTDAAIQKHYSSGEILARIEAALAKAGVDPQRPAYQDLFPFDQLHERGVVATREHAKRAGLAPGMHVLDLGCGIGGASRVLAAEFGCRVTGIDFTPEFIAVATALTARCGLSDRTSYREADALRLPFADASFDHVWSQFVTMNIADKSGLAREVARVLRPGGRFTCAELNQGPGGAPVFPLPWASEPALSFLVTPEAMHEALAAAGLKVVEQIDLSKESMAYVGEGFRERARNVGRCYMERPIVCQLFIGGRP